MILPKKGELIILEDLEIVNLLAGYKVAKVIKSNSEDYWENDIVYFLDGFQNKIIYNNGEYYVLDSRHVDFVEDD